MAPVQSGSMFTKEPKIRTKNRTLVRADGTFVIRGFFFGANLKGYDLLRKDSRPTDVPLHRQKQKKKNKKQTQMFQKVAFGYTV